MPRHPVAQPGAHPGMSWLRPPPQPIRRSERASCHASLCPSVYPSRGPPPPSPQARWGARPRIYEDQLMKATPPRLATSRGACGDRLTSPDAVASEVAHAGAHPSPYRGGRAGLAVVLGLHLRLLGVWASEEGVQLLHQAVVPLIGRRVSLDQHPLPRHKLRRSLPIHPQQQRFTWMRPWPGKEGGP
jgi:hypothetical protein